MSALQQINQGTAAANGSDGDTVRSAFTKVNANTTALGAQVVFSSGPTLSSTTVLDNTILGKRVIINFSAAGSVTLPKASTCQFDGVIQLVNISAVTATIPVVSGDTGPSFSLAPGESTTVFTDGVSTWTASERNRSTRPDESVSGNLSVTRKVNSVNSPNLLFNGSAEFGVLGGWGPSGFISAYNSGTAEGTFFSNAAAVNSNVYVGSNPIPMAAGVPLTLSGEVYTAGVTSGAGWFRLVFLNSSSGVISSSQSISAPNGSGWTYGSMTTTTPASTAYIYVQIALENLGGSAAAASGGAAWRRIKLEKGTTPSQYSQEASIAYLQTALVGAGASSYSSVIGSRAVGTTYTNSTPRPLFVIVETQLGSSGAMTMRVNSIEVANIANAAAVSSYATISAVVPPGATYQVVNNTGTNSVLAWNEY
ncbi:hypothetical protein [Burkholderia cenocepacia]